MTDSAEAAHPAPDVTIITGLSGAGRSEAAKALEDSGYFVIDNLPPALLDKMVELASMPRTPLSRLAAVVDVRGGEFFTDVEKVLASLRKRDVEHRVIFLEASDEALSRRYEATRRPHPLSESERVLDGIAREREMLRGLRERADIVIDTTDLNVHELRDKMKTLVAAAAPGESVALNVVTFGYKHGAPLDADIILDCRFLPNPHWQEELRPLDGTDGRVREYVLNAEGAGEFLGKVKELVALVLPGFVREGRHYVTIGVGCTGGKHRSVVIGDEIARMLQELGLPAQVVHRDIDKE